ncbi:hypothetical protein L596_015519 [Steinernema carpocapsae]|uniref:ENT domain-containing protein n=1 Tax=Steinernema carpocapsae TaxID=34508 RepID=A0A4U5NF88_STECR|nr:hypothetical protein L596_015519 [Steinernema carpocapsae]
MEVPTRVNGVASPNEDEDEWNTEDCIYMLRRLEQSALTTLISAMRAQGGLSEYREKILNHVRNILHFTETQMSTEMRRAANDPCLAKISETLNPHYDTFSQWSAGGLNSAANDFELLPKTKNIKKEENGGGEEDGIMAFADKLLGLAEKHNESVLESKDLARELTELPAVPYVPESMRVLLRTTESEAAQRIALDSTRPKTRKEKAVVPSPYVTPLKRRPTREEYNITPLKRKPGRRPKSESISIAPTVTPPFIPEPIIVKPEFTASPMKAEIKPESASAAAIPERVNGTFHQEEEPVAYSEPHPQALTQQERIESVVAEVVASQSPPASHDTSDEQPGCSRNSVSLLSDDPPFPPEEYLSNASLLVGGKLQQRRKRSKPRDNSTCVCARVQPFIFEPQVPGKPKPPRGNPDRRTAKRPSPPSLSAFPHSVTAPMLSPGGLPPQPSAVFNGSAETPSTSVESSAPTSTKTSPSQSTPAYAAPTPVKTAHFITPGTFIKRARTVSTGDATSVIAEGVKSTILRGHAQTGGVPKGFVRSTNGTTRLYVQPNPSASQSSTVVAQGTAVYTTPNRQYYVPCAGRASSVSSDGGSSTSSAQQGQGPHIASLVTPGGTVTRVASTPIATSSPAKGGKSPAYSEGAPSSSGNEQTSSAPTAYVTAQVPASAAYVTKNTIIKRSIIARHNSSSSGARILAGGPQIIRRAPMQMSSEHGVVYTALQPQQSFSERGSGASPIVVRNVVAPLGLKPSEQRRTVTVIPASLGSSQIVIRKSESSAEATADKEPKQEQATLQATETSPPEVVPPTAELLMPVEECYPLTETISEPQPSVPSTSTETETKAEEVIESAVPSPEATEKVVPEAIEAAPEPAASESFGPPVEEVEEAPSPSAGSYRVQESEPPSQATDESLPPEASSSEQLIPESEAPVPQEFTETSAYEQVDPSTPAEGSPIPEQVGSAATE